MYYDDRKYSISSNSNLVVKNRLQKRRVVRVQMDMVTSVCSKQYHFVVKKYNTQVDPHRNAVYSNAAGKSTALHVRL